MDNKNFDIKQEEDNLRDVFKQFDVEKTGQITKKVFLKELIKLYGEEDAKQLTNKIIPVASINPLYFFILLLTISCNNYYYKNNYSYNKEN